MFTVSVIIPNYNNEKYLETCLDSVLAQTYPIKEIIIYDDCSTDNSRAILEDYRKRDNRIQLILGNKNVGVSIARDAAIMQTTSDYVCMLDADDYLYSANKIEAEMNVVNSIYNQTGEWVVCFSQTVDVDEDGVPLGSVDHVDLTGNERFRIVTRMYSKYMPRDYCFPKKYYVDCGGYTKGLSLYEDWELNIKLLGFTKFVYSGEYGTAYRHKAGGLSSVKYEKQFNTKKMILRSNNITLKERVVGYVLAWAAYLKHRIKG